MTGDDQAHLAVRMVEQRLGLRQAQGSPARAALELHCVHRGVPLVADLHRVRAEASLALRRPAIAGIGDEVAEHAQRALIAPQRRMGPPGAATAKRRREVLQILRAPLPRVLTGEHREPAHQPPAGRDGGLVQQPAALLARPALQHRVEQRPLRVQGHHAGEQDQPRRPCQPTLVSRITAVYTPSTTLCIHRRIVASKDRQHANPHLSATAPHQGPPLPARPQLP